MKNQTISLIIMLLKCKINMFIFSFLNKHFTILLLILINVPKNVMKLTFLMDILPIVISENLKTCNLN